jgi:hypothetical protein
MVILVDVDEGIGGEVNRGYRDRPGAGCGAALTLCYPPQVLAGNFLSLTKVSSAMAVKRSRYGANAFSAFLIVVHPIFFCPLSLT